MKCMLSWPILTIISDYKRLKLNAKLNLRENADCFHLPPSMSCLAITKAVEPVAQLLFTYEETNLYNNKNFIISLYKTELN